MIPPREFAGPGGTAGPADPARALARTVLYEGYMLWPYRRSAPKNQRRWTFGGVHPRSWSESGHPDDAWRMRVECLFELPSGHPPEVRVGLRFLQVVRRTILKAGPDGLRPVDRFELDGRTWLTWDEARERQVVSPPLPIEPGAEARAPIRIEAGSERTWLRDGSGRRRAAVERSWRALEGALTVGVAPIEPAPSDAAAAGLGPVARIRVLAANTTGWRGEDRDDALRSSFASAHLVLRAPGVRSGEAGFVSLTDPPEDLAAVAGDCRNDGWWPVLLGERGSRDTLLASPIILPDYPVVAPESPGDLFDGGEIDEMLALHILALTDAEKEEMRATDPRTREILERTATLDADRMRALHGTFRDEETGEPIDDALADPTGGARRPGGLAAGAPDPFWVEMGRPAAAETVVDGVELRRGSRVRLRPRPGGDVMDIALEGRVGVVEGIDEDDRGGVQLAIAVEDDPGFDLGMERMPGHRFFFRPGEIEPLERPRSGGPGSPGRPHRTRVLVAGIGNVFFGDDGFGVEVSRRLARRPLPEGVTVRDFGIRGLDLAYELASYDVVVLVDAVPRGEAAGTLRLIDASDMDPGPPDPQAHGMDPVRVLALAAELGPVPDRVYVLGCEPAEVLDPDADDLRAELSDPVERAVEPAVERLESLAAELVSAVAGPGTDPAARGKEHARTPEQEVER